MRRSRPLTPPILATGPAATTVRSRAMILDRLRADERRDGIELSARVRWAGPEFRLRVQVPPGAAPAEGEASGFVAMVLLQAMRWGEPAIEIDGLVSKRLLYGIEEVQAALTTYSPDLRRC